jgi:apolipoprotein N-acyltransferase
MKQQSSTKNTKDTKKEDETKMDSSHLPQSLPKFRLSSLFSSCSSCPSWTMAFSGAVLLWAAFPPLDLWLLAWVAPIPWVLLIRRKELPGRRPYAMLTLAGFCFWITALHWLRLPHPATSIGWVALSFYFAFYLPAFVGLSRVAVHRLRIPAVFAAPIVWTGLELVRAHLLTGMTMASLGHTQYRWIQMIQISDLAGAFGVSFVVMLAAASVASIFPCDGRRWRLWPLAPALAVLAAAMFYGHLRTADEQTMPGPRIALVQGSIDVQMLSDPDPAVRERRIMEQKDRIYKEYCGLSQEAVEKDRKIELVVWPESMFPDPVLSFDADARRPPDFGGTEAEFRDLTQRAADLKLSGMAWPLMAETVQGLGAPLLLGADTLHVGSQAVRCFSSAVYVARDGHLLDRYDKMHLVMFGEYVPFAQYFPWLQKFTPLPISATPGERPAAFELAGVRIAPNICYESVLSHVIRRQINALAAEGKEPHVLINLTNDGWFWGSSELDMHLVCGVFRAVECRKPLLIAANTGFSAWIDGDGRILEQGPRHAKGVIIAQPRLDQRSSWYLTHGDWFAGLCLVTCGLCGLVGIYDGCRHPHHGGKSQDQS